MEGYILELDETAEAPEKYLEGLYYPICIGEILRSYRVVHKLGHDTYSTVWTTHDMRRQKDIAPKLIRLGKPERYIYDAEGNPSLCDGHFQYSYVPEHVPTSCPRRFCRTFSPRLPCTMPKSQLHFLQKKWSVATRMMAAGQLLSALQSLHFGGIVH